MIKNVFWTITSFDNLIHAEAECAQGKRLTAERLRFWNEKELLCLKLSRMLRSEIVPMVKYRSFYVYAPKVRKVIYIDYTSKVIQRAIYDVVNPLLVKGFIKDTFACIPGRGQLAAKDRVCEWMEGARSSGEQWYYYKFDVAKFFYRIDHDVLIKLLEQKISDRRTIELIAYYVTNQHVPFGMPVDAESSVIPDDQMIYGLGIPIGGGLSHMLGNLYLDPLDQYCKRVLRIKRYIRYMDDILIFSTDKAQLKEWAEQMRTFLRDRLHLQFNRKCALRPVGCGVEWVGYHIYPDHAIPRKKTTIRMSRHLRKNKKDYRDYKVDLWHCTQSLHSYLGLLKWCDCKNFRAAMIRRYVLTHAKKGGGTTTTKNETEPSAARLGRMLEGTDELIGNLNQIIRIQSTAIDSLFRSLALYAAADEIDAHPAVALINEAARIAHDSGIEIQEGNGGEKWKKS